jgi:hypothetical protein
LPGSSNGLTQLWYARSMAADSNGQTEGGQHDGTV